MLVYELVIRSFDTYPSILFDVAIYVILIIVESVYLRRIDIDEVDL